METRKRPQTNNSTNARSEEGRERRRGGGSGAAGEGGNRRAAPRDQPQPQQSRSGYAGARGGGGAPGRGRGGKTTHAGRDAPTPAPSPAAAPAPAPSAVVRAALPSKPAPWAVRAAPAAAAPAAAAPAPAAAAAAVPVTAGSTAAPPPVTTETVVAVPLPASPSSGEQPPLGPVAVAVVAPAPSSLPSSSSSSSAKEARLDEVAGLCLGSFDATELPTARSPIVPSPSSPLPEKEAPPAGATPPSPAPASTAAAAPSPAETTNGHVTSPAASTDDSTSASAAAPQATAENGASSAGPEAAVRKPVVNAWGKGAPAILQKYMEAQKKAAAQQQQQRPPAPTAAAALRHFDEVRLVWDASFAHAALRGLHNEGNTCFLNATVQCLLACPPFIGFLRSLRSRGFPCPAPTLAELVRFAEAFELEKKANTQLVPLAAKAHFAAVIKKLAGTPGRQEDAHEFLSLLLDTVHEELRAGSAKARAGGGGESAAHHKAAAHNETNEWNEVGRKNKTSKLRTAEFEDTAVTRIFGCKLRSCLKSRGAKQSITQELFNALPLDVSVHQIRSLDDALLGFMSAESLDWEVRASKEYKFERMPGVLVVHLKRFAFSAAGGDKIAKHIEFPERLVIPTKLLGPHAGGGEKERRSYDLFGVVEHHGHTLQSGHYTASIKRDQHWYHVDDTTINPTTIQTVLRRQAYLLFYLRASSPSSSSH